MMSALLLGIRVNFTINKSNRKNCFVHKPFNSQAVMLIDIYVKWMQTETSINFTYQFPEG